MQVSLSSTGRSSALQGLLAAVSAMLILGCCTGNGSNQPTSKPAGTIDLAPFIQTAQKSICHDQRNRLFLIDQHLVLWDRAGTCIENGYGQILYADSLATILCERHDSIGGEIKTYNSPQEQPLFDAVVANLDRPDLGLGATHTVQAISF